MSNLIYPNINPVLLSLGPIQIHWYGLMYLIGFMSAWLLALYRARGSKIWSSILISDVIFYCATGVLIGGRVGYMFLYDFSGFIKNPLDIFKIWQGGMAFHGGLLGVLVAIIFFCRKNKINFFTVSDFIVPLVPIGLGAGRIGNFINGELWGRVTQMPWGLIYPQAGPLPRHPSEIYEFLLEGLILFIILWWFSGKRPPRMATSGMFLLIYGVFRIFCELFRQPDEQIGFVLFGWMTKGQLLSIPMVIAGLFLLYLAYFYKRNVIYRIIDCELIQGKNWRLTVHLIGKEAVFYCSPNEILMKLDMLDKFSKRDAKKIHCLLNTSHFPKQKEDKDRSSGEFNF